MLKNLLFVALFAPAFLAAQTTFFFDDFESYSPGDYLGVASDDWTTWSGTEGGLEDAQISDAQAAMGSNSVYLQDDDDIDIQDLFLPLGDQDVGQWSISFYLMVMSGNGISFNVQKHADNSDPIWGTEAQFNNDGSAIWISEGQNTPFSFTHDQWMHIEIIIDIDADLGEARVNGVVVDQWIWSISNAGANVNTLGGFNIYSWAATGSSECYFDEFLVQGPDASSINLNASNNLIRLYPNPASSNIQVEGASQIESWQVFDVHGKFIEMGSTMSSMNLDISQLNAGLYSLRVWVENRWIMQRFVKI